MPNKSQVLPPQRPFKASPFYVPEKSTFYAPNLQPTLQSTTLSSDPDLEDDDDTPEPPRGRKRRRSSVALPPDQQMSTLHGRGRNRSWSSPNEETEAASGSAVNSGDSEEEDGDVPNENETSNEANNPDTVLAASRRVLAAMKAYFNTHTTTPEIRAALSEFETAVAQETAPCYPNANEKRSNLSDETSQVFGKATAVLNAMRTHFNTHEPTSPLRASMKRLEDLFQKSAPGELNIPPTHRPSISAPFTFPSNVRPNEGPHVKKRRSQSPSRSRSAGGENGTSPRPRRRQRTRSRSRSHGLGRGGISKGVLASY